MPKNVPPLAQDLIRKLLTVSPELRLGAADMYDLMRHKFFDGIDFETIHDMEPPEKFHLTKMQTIMMKYLPQYVHETIRKQRMNKGVPADSRSHDGESPSL